MTEFDVVVIGGGPAGCAAAITLARKNFRVALIEKTNYDRARIGETLVPAARAPLERLGVWQPFLASEHAASPGTVAAWGDGAWYENDFIFNPYGNGWHLDRARFDRDLAARAEKTGAKIFRSARISSIQNITRNEVEGLDKDATGFFGSLRMTDQGWRVEFVCARETKTVETPFLVDATGRARLVTRSLGVVSHELDSLVGLVRFFRHAEEDDNRTLVEAAREGWWYAARLPGARLVVAYMTDADLIAEGRARADEWNARLRETLFTRRRVENSAAESALTTWSANSYLLDYVAGANWLAVGDAAMAFDPLSSQGIFNALESGLRAGDAIAEWFDGDARGFDAYAAWLNARFDSYARNRMRYYAHETRWRDSLFWQRRQTQVEYAGPTQG